MSTQQTIPKDFPVQPISPGSPEALEAGDNLAHCGACDRYWDDGKPTTYTPTPGARCPFEAFHPEPEEETEPDKTAALRIAQAVINYAATVEAPGRDPAYEMNAAERGAFLEMKAAAEDVAGEVTPPRVPSMLDRAIVRIVGLTEQVAAAAEGHALGRYYADGKGTLHAIVIPLHDLIALREAFTTDAEPLPITIDDRQQQAGS